MKEDSFKYNFTICISSLFGNYNNVLQFAQTMEMYKLLGVQRVVIYNTSCGPDLEKLLQHYEKAGFLEIVPWPIDQFLKPSAGWNIKFHKGDIQYYGQLVTLNECIYRHMYQSKYVLLNDIDEIIMPYKYANLALLMEALQQEHKEVTVFLIENHIFPKTQFEETDVLCQGKHTQHATHVAISADEHTDINNLDFLPVKNRMKEDSFKYNFTICISSLFGNYNNVLQFAQTMEMYKLLGVQRVVIYNTSCGPDLEKLLQHYEKAGFLEIVPWPIDQFLKPSAGWNIKFHKGDIQYYGQLVTLNECIYRHMYQSKYVLLNDIDEIIMPYKYANLALLMEALQQEHKEVTVFLIENHIFPKTQFEETAQGKTL
ncbi:hypothetical protein KOW79_004112 [Hemibagrus wyckioides]|uniref:Glycosyltransferase family 92 protein n=1 Tax=Hemibagrus wyckioides TaxID=337641 RepID=A0A9D3P3K0_9TELE|nr:hypothetical protein KOW79_004112 [Hemibagrus wyckioides]